MFSDFFILQKNEFYFFYFCKFINAKVEKDEMDTILEKII
jgi:hypothetical protein